MHSLLAAASQTSTAQPVSATSLLFQLLIGLAVILGLIWVAARIARGRIGVPGTKRRHSPLAVVSRQPLGKGIQLAVVKAGTEMYLLGVTAHQVTRLARFGPGEADLFDPSSAVGQAGAGRDDSPDDLPPAGPPGPSGAPMPYRLQCTIRQLQERTLRKG